MHGNFKDRVGPTCQTKVLQTNANKRVTDERATRTLLPFTGFKKDGWDSCWVEQMPEALRDELPFFTAKHVLHR